MNRFRLSKFQVTAYHLGSEECRGSVLKTSKARQLYGSASGNFVACIERNSLFVWEDGTERGAKAPFNFAHTKPYTVSQCLGAYQFQNHHLNSGE